MNAPPNSPSAISMSRTRLPASGETILLLTVLAAVGQFSSNVYTPSLPGLAADMGVSAAAAQTTYVVFLAAFALSQLIWGPVADAFGRRPAVIAGLAVFIAGTAACTFAGDLLTLTVARVVQATGAAAGIVVSRAATRDSFDGVELAKVLATVTIAFALVPGLTPMIGGIADWFGGWRASFALALLVGIALLVFALLRLPETVPERHPFSLARAAGDYAKIARDRVFLSWTLAAGLVFGAMGAFFAASPQLYIVVLGISPTEYGFYPPVSVTGFILGALTVRRLSGRVPPPRIAAVGLSIMLVAVCAMTAFPLLGLVHKHLYTGAMALNVTGLGVFLPIAIASALQRFPGAAGSAASIQGAIQMMGGASGAVVVGLFQDEAPLIAMPVTMVCAVLGAILVRLVLTTHATPAPQAGGADA